MAIFASFAFDLRQGNKELSIAQAPGARSLCAACLFSGRDYTSSIEAKIQSPDLGRWMGWASSGGPPREARPLDNEVVGKILICRDVPHNLVAQGTAQGRKTPERGQFPGFASLRQRGQGEEHGDQIQRNRVNRRSSPAKPNIKIRSPTLLHPTRKQTGRCYRPTDNKRNRTSNAK